VRAVDDRETWLAGALGRLPKSSIPTSGKKSRKLASMRAKRFIAKLAWTAAALTVVSCASLKTPTLQVEAVKVDKLRLTGAGLDVAFRVQNPNPDNLLIERFEYQLSIDGKSLGHGYYSEPIRLDGFKDERVDSRFAINFLHLPGAVQAVLDQDRAKVQVDGTFYVRQGNDLKKLVFKNDANIDLKK
jgi:LEA14-like dessication related protein